MSTKFFQNVIGILTRKAAKVNYSTQLGQIPHKYCPNFMASIDRNCVKYFRVKRVKIKSSN